MADTMNTPLEVLRSVDLFAVLPVEDQVVIASGARSRRFSEGDAICHQGDPGRTMFVVASGEVAVLADEVEIARLGPGSYFGEMSLLTGEARTATVQAVGRTAVIELDRPGFARVFSTNVVLAQQVSDVVARRRLELKEHTKEAARARVETEAESIFSRLKGIFGL